MGRGDALNGLKTSEITRKPKVNSQTLVYIPHSIPPFALAAAHSQSETSNKPKHGLPQIAKAPRFQRSQVRSWQSLA